MSRNSKGFQLLTARVVGLTWEVRSCLIGPPVLNSLLGVICQNPTGGSKQMKPWTLLSLFSHEYWYLSSTYSLEGKHKSWGLSTKWLYISNKKHIFTPTENVIYTSPLNSGSTGSTSWTASGYANSFPLGGTRSSGRGISLCLSSAIAMYRNLKVGYKYITSSVIQQFCWWN